MKYLLLGGTGFIGKKLADLLAVENHDVIVFTRNPGKYTNYFNPRISLVAVDYSRPELISRHFSDSYSVINLAGENIASGIWTKKKKEKILQSRLRSVKFLCKAIDIAGNHPDVILQASATGFYGSSDNLIFKEENEAGNGFLADVTRQWEQQLREYKMPSGRKVFFRTGMVMGNDGGIFPSLLSMVKYFAGIIPGSGKQYIPWIHIDDEINAVRFLLDLPGAQGAYNLTGKVPATMEDLVRQMAKLHNRPVWFRIPAALLRFMAGEMADELILTSQNVYPAKLIDAGYRFKFPELEDACLDLIKQSRNK